MEEEEGLRFGHLVATTIKWQSNSTYHSITQLIINDMIEGDRRNVILRRFYFFIGDNTQKQCNAVMCKNKRLRE